ncbi:cell division protein FtsQ/DivIB [Candidatus Omnitrophota bacterium]
MKKAHKKKIKRLLRVVVAAAILAVIIFLGFAIARFFSTSSLFVVTKFSTNLDDRIGPDMGKVRLPSGIVGSKNIFSVDIQALSRELMSRYPQYKAITLKRRFPDTLEIEFSGRQPLFQIKLSGRYWFVDDEYIIISGPHLKPYANMVEVSAVLPKGISVFIGKKIHFSHSDRVRSLLQELSGQGFLAHFKVSKLSAYSLNDIWFDLEGVEIRVGSGDYAKKLSLLRRLILPRFEGDFEKIEYIDLRFKDYVVGYKR